jgi:FAS-associated factor 2
VEPSPDQLAREFQQQFREQYGEKGPQFFEGSYSQALETAKKELQYLLVLLHSEDHDDTHQFCVETLSSEAFVQYIHEKNIIIWGGNIKFSEPYKVSTMLGATRYPFMAAIALHENRMKVIHRFEGLESVSKVTEIMDRLMERLDRSYEQARQERASRDAARLIREQQDAAYQESLRLDREKAERARKEMEYQRQQEEAEKQLAMEVERKREV